MHWLDDEDDKQAKRARQKAAAQLAAELFATEPAPPVVNVFDEPEPDTSALADVWLAPEADTSGLADIWLLEGTRRAPAGPRVTPELLRGAVLATLRDAGGLVTFDELAERVARRFKAFPAREMVSVLTAGALDAALTLGTRIERGRETVLVGKLLVDGASKLADAVAIRGREQRSGARWLTIGDDDHAKWLSAVHEAGHAVAGALCESARVEAVSIKPGHKGGGETLTRFREGARRDPRFQPERLRLLACGDEAVRAIIGPHAAGWGADGDLEKIAMERAAPSVVQRARAEAAKLVTRERPAILDAACRLYRTGRLTPPQIATLVEGVRTRNASTFKL